MATQASAVQAIKTVGGQRLGDDLGLFNTAISSFQTHVTQLSNLLPHGKAEFNFMTVVIAVTPAIKVMFPVEGIEHEVAKELIGTVFDGMEEMVKGHFETNFAERREAAKEQLADAAAALVAAANTAMSTTFAQLHTGLEHAADTLLTAHPYMLESSPESVCDELGVPDPTLRVGHDDVRARLEEAFAGVYYRVDAELKGVTGEMLTADSVAARGVELATHGFAEHGDHYWDQETADFKEADYKWENDIS